jgi:hypothetical protein
MKYGLLWLRSNDRVLLRFAIIGILLLTTIHLYLSLSLVDPHSGFFDLLRIATILILLIMFVSILIKGLVPTAISCLGIVLLYGSIVIPSTIDNSLGPLYYKASTGYLTFETIIYGTHGFFLLGVAMIIVGMIVAYKPHILYTRNRPISAEQLWTKYPNWNENLQLANTRTDSLIGLSGLLNETERYLLWRYEFILVFIYGTVYRVPIYSHVPINSTVMRESKSLRIIGAPKYGYFM